MSRSPESFDAGYYHRFYVDPRTRAATPEEVERQVAFVAAYLAHLQIPVRSILDIGCGVGVMAAALRRAYPEAGFQGVDASPHACETHGWKQASVVDYRPRRRFDLVVCHDVLQYLDHRAAARAVENLAALTREVMLLAVLTREDVSEDLFDPERTDMEVVLRSTGWYRRRLRSAFVNVGGGLFLKRDRSPVVWSLEHLDPPGVG